HIDIVVASSANAGIYARLLKIFFPKLIIVYVSHGWSAIYRGNMMFRAVETMLSYLSTSILAISQSDYHKAVDILKINPKKVVLIENAIYPYINVNTNVKRKDSKGIVVVMIARFEYPKRQDLLIQAAKKLPEVQFKFVGEGKNLENCKNEAPNNVCFLQASTNIEEVLAEADIFALLSESEGMPISVLEALACKKPILLSKIPAMDIFIEENGFLVKNDIDEVVTAIKRLGESNLDDMGKASLKLFDDRFNLSNHMKKFITFYEDISR
ncbi:MAG: glycosyltransferase, partial [Epsilonproteobacteria bacterium]|nr:glycosyltransferase [Campylobacterota bacterium]